MYAFAGTDDDSFVNVYTTEDSPIWQDIFTKFGEKTKIRVRYSVQNQETLQKAITTEYENPKADVVISGNMPLLWQLEKQKMLQPTVSLVLESSIPTYSSNGTWFAVAKDAVIIAYSKDQNKSIPGGISSYEALASPIYKGMLCVTTPENNQSLISTMLFNHGSKRTKLWIDGIVSNLVQPSYKNPKNLLNDLISGKCEIGLISSDAVRELSPEIQEKIGIVYPNQGDKGTHFNMMAAATIKSAPHRDEAFKLIEFLASKTAQETLAKTHYKIVDIISKPDQKSGDTIPFKEDKTSMTTLAIHNDIAYRLLKEAGW